MNRFKKLPDYLPERVAKSGKHTRSIGLTGFPSNDKVSRLAAQQNPFFMSHFISLQEGIDMTSLYRSQKENILKTQFQNQNILPLSETFDRTAFDTILAKIGCEGMRIYYGMDENLKIHAIIVGVDEEGKDMIPEEASLTEEEEDIIEKGNRCPDLCPSESPLNT